MAFCLCVCISVSKFFSSKDTSHIRLKAHPKSVWHHLNLITSALTLFPIKIIITGSSRHEFCKDTIQPREMWYLVLNTCYFLPFMIHSDQFSSQLTHCLPQELWGACHCIPLYVYPLLSRNTCPLLNNLVPPFLLLPENSHQGKPINGISFLFISQIFTAPRLPKSGLMSSMASSDLPCGQDTKTQSILGMNTVTV